MSIAIEPLVVFTLLNITLTVGLYISNLSGQLSLATAAIAGIGGYISAILTSRMGVPFLVAIFAAATAGAMVGTALALLTCRMEMFILKLVTLAFGEAIVVIAFNIDYLGGANSFTGIRLDTNWENSLVLALCAVAIAHFIDRSPVGYAARAIRDDSLAASAMGLSIRGIKIFTFAVSTGIIAVAGALQAHYLLVINPHDLAFFVSLTIVIFLLFGGMQTLWGAVCGATILTILPELLRFTNEYRLILFGALVVLVVLLRPDGLLTRRPLTTKRNVVLPPWGSPDPEKRPEMGTTKSRRI